MIEIPSFTIYGNGDPQIEGNIQPRLTLRGWDDLQAEDKKIALQELTNLRWVRDYSHEIIRTISFLNHCHLQLCPGKNLHNIIGGNRGAADDSRGMAAALKDFQTIFLTYSPGDMVVRMLSKFAECHIDNAFIKSAENTDDEDEKIEHIRRAFETFDRLARCLNHIFEQFSVNLCITRNGFIPKQDQKILDEIYVPTLAAFSDPKWKAVSVDLNLMFEDYSDENYSEVITKAHSAVHRFLQILVGEEGKSGKGDIGKLFNEGKRTGIIPIDRFTEPIISAFQGFISSERAKNSTAKPALSEATSSDALLIMNVVMVFFQHCLQSSK